MWPSRKSVNASAVVFFQIVVCTACAEVIDADGMLCGLAFCTRIYSNTQLKCSLDNYLKMVAD